MLNIKTFIRGCTWRNRALRLLFLGGNLLMLFGCRQYELYHYKTIKDELLGGEIVIEVVPSRTLSEKNGKKIAVESDPYSILFKFFSDVKFKTISVDELVLKSASGDVKIDLSSGSSLEASVYPNSTRYFAIASFSKNLESRKLKFEPYDLSATLSVKSSDGNITKSELMYRLEPDFKRESRSDILEGMMGI